MRERFTESYLGTWELFGEKAEKKLGKYKYFESDF